MDKCHKSVPHPHTSLTPTQNQLLTSYQHSTRIRLMETHILKLRPWVNYLTSVRLMSFLWEMVIIIIPTKQLCEFNENIVMEVFLPVDGASPSISFPKKRHWFSLCPAFSKYKDETYKLQGLSMGSSDLDACARSTSLSLRSQASSSD